MLINGTSDLAPTSDYTSVPASGQSASQAPAVTASTSSGEDSVQLSSSAQASAMHHQGMSVKQIATNMGVTTQIVDQYLGITSSSGGGGGVGGGGGHVAHSAPAKGGHSQGQTTAGSKNSASKAPALT